MAALKPRARYARRMWRWIVPAVVLAVAGWLLWADRSSPSGAALRGPRHDDPQGAQPVLEGLLAGAPPSANAPHPTDAPSAADGEVRADPRGPFKQVRADPIKAGACVLDVNVRRLRDGAPLETEVQLWRLDAPGNQWWGRGDQFQARAGLKDGHVRLERLVAGSYRLRVPGAAKGAADPPAFEVAGEHTRVDLEVEMPREVRALLRVVDGAGVAIDAPANLIASFGVQVHHSAHLPPWSSQRAPLDPEHPEGRMPVIPRATPTRSPTTEALSPERGVYPLPAVERASHGSKPYARCTLSWPGRSGVRAIVLDPGADREHLGALSVPLSMFHDIVHLPDGRRAKDAGARFEAHCDAVRSRQGVALDPRHFMLLLRVTLDGYQTLDGLYTIDELRERIVMRRAEAPVGKR